MGCDGVCVQRSAAIAAAREDMGGQRGMSCAVAGDCFGRERARSNAMGHGQRGMSCAVAGDCFGRERARSNAMGHGHEVCYRRAVITDLAARITLVILHLL